MKETLKDKFNKVKTSVKQSYDQATADDKTQINKDVKQQNLTGQRDQQKPGFQRSDKI